MAARVRGRVRHSSWLARRSKPARSPARGQCAGRPRRQDQLWTEDGSRTGTV